MSGTGPPPDLLVGRQLHSSKMETQGRPTPDKVLPGGKGKLMRYSSFYPGVKQADNAHKQKLTLTGNNMKTGGSEIRKKTVKKSNKSTDVGGPPRQAKDQAQKVKKKVTNDAKQRREKFEAMLEGKLTDLPAKPKSIVRIFLSSTFSDMRAERNTLARMVYPVLKEYCASLDLDFQVVDMRWGVTEDSQNDHSVEEMCLREIRNCQNLSLGPNFVCILGNRYGFQLIPHRIISSEFLDILNEVVTMGKDNLDVLSKWYIADHNAVPSHHILQPIRSHYPHFGDNSVGHEDLSTKHAQAWNTELNQLRQTLRSAAVALHKAGKMSDERLQQFHWSVTECEINSGIMGAEDPKSQALFFHRDLVGMTDAAADDAGFQYIDCTQEEGQVSVDDDAQMKLHKLATDNIIKKLGKNNCFQFRLPWRCGGVNPMKSKDHSTYIYNFCKTFTEKVIELIDEGFENRHGFVKSSNYYSEPDEIIHHLQFCIEKCKTFCGREETLMSVKKYVLDKSNRKPLIIHAESGAGKTSLMACVMKNLGEWFRKPHIGVIRFLGTSPGTISLYDVLFSICGQLADNNDLIMEPVGYQNFASLVQYMPRFLRRVATAAKVPIVILLDSIDQLSSAHSAYLMKWLPLTLPQNVYLILSTLPKEHNILENIKRRLPDKSCYLQVPILPEITVKEIVDKYLQCKDRTLTKQQMLILTEKFQLDPCPLYLKLLLDKAATWYSYTKLSDMELGDTARIAIHLLFESLERKFGTRLVQTALGFITVSLNGITEIEMEDVLSCDDEVLNDVYEFHDPPVEGIVRIPPLLWARIHHDLKEYLVERLSHGKTTMYWYHRQFIEVASERFLTGDNGTIMHKKMLEIFLSDSGVQRGITLAKRNKTFPDADRQVTHQPMIVKNKRKLECITHHLIHAKSIVSIETAKGSVFCNYDFLTTKISAFSVQHVLSEMDVFLAERPDREIQAVRDFMKNSVADLRYPMHLAVQLLAGVANTGGCGFLEELLSRARFCVNNHTSPVLIPEGPCFAPRELADLAVTDCIVGCKDIIGSCGNYVCLEEEGIEDGDPVCGVLNIVTGEHDLFEKIKLQNYPVAPILHDNNIYLFTQNSLTICNLITSEWTTLDINSDTKDAADCTVLSQLGKLVGMLYSCGMLHVWDLTTRECVDSITLTEWLNVQNICVPDGDRRHFVITGSLKNSINDQAGTVLCKSFNGSETDTIYTQYPLKPDSLRTLPGVHLPSLPDIPFVVGLSQSPTKTSFIHIIGYDPLQVLRTVKIESDVKVMECFDSAHQALACVFTHTNDIQLFNLDTRQRIFSVDLEEDLPICLLPTYVNLGDTSAIAVGGTTGNVTFFSLENGEDIGHIKAFESNVKGILIKDKRLIAYSENTQLKVWDIDKLLSEGGVLNSDMVKEDGSLYDETYSCATEISLCSRRLYTATKRKNICVWDVNTGELLTHYHCGMVASDIKVCRGETELLVVFGKRRETVKVLHSSDGKEAIKDMPRNALSVALSKDKSTLYVITHADGRLKLHEFELLKLRLTRQFPLQKGLNFKSVNAVLSMTERYMVLIVECTADDRKSIESQWKKGGFPPQPHPYRFSAIDLTHTSGTLLHCYRSMSKIPALGTRMIAHTGNTMIFCVRRCVCFWDIPTGRCDQMITKSGRHGMFYNPSWHGGGDADVTGYAKNIIQSADGSFVVLGSDDGYVTIYQSKNGAPVGMKAPLTKHHVPITELAVSSDSKWVISACQKGILKLWDSRTAKEHFSLKLDGKVRQVLVSPDSQHLLVMTGTNITRILLFKIYPGKDES